MNMTPSPQPIHDLITHNRVSARKDEKRLKIRAVGMLAGFIAAHIFAGIVIHYTYMDDNDAFHTSYMGLLGVFVSAMIFLYHMGIA